MSDCNNVIWIEGTPVGISLYKAESIKPHSHRDVFEFFICLDGEIEYCDCYETFKLSAGEFFLAEDAIHYFINGNNAVCASIFLKKEWFRSIHPYIESLWFVCEGSESSIITTDFTNHRILKSMLITILSLVCDNISKNGNIICETNLLSQRIIDFLVDKFDIYTYNCPNETLTGEQLMRYRNMFAYVNENYKDNIKAADLGNEFGFSTAYIYELSKLTKGFQKRINFLKLGKAQELLFYTDMSINQVSEESGFSTVKYFYKIFKSYYGCTPKEYKEKMNRLLNDGSKLENCSYSDLKELINKHIAESLKYLVLYK